MFTIPEPTPVTAPKPFTVAIVASLVLHVPPATASVNVVTEPWHNEAAPLIPPTTEEGFTATNCVLKHPPAE
jgi:hypothetical protein